MDYFFLRNSTVLHTSQHSAAPAGAKFEQKKNSRRHKHGPWGEMAHILSRPLTTQGPFTSTSAWPNLNSSPFRFARWRCSILCGLFAILICVCSLAPPRRADNHDRGGGGGGGLRVATLLTYLGGTLRRTDAGGLFGRVSFPYFLTSFDSGPNLYLWEYRAAILN